MQWAWLNVIMYYGIRHNNHSRATVITSK